MITTAIILLTISVIMAAYHTLFQNKYRFLYFILASIAYFALMVIAIPCLFWLYVLLSLIINILF